MINFFEDELEVMPILVQYFVASTTKASFVMP
jgi:hypothetical protein